MARLLLTLAVAVSGCARAAAPPAPRDRLSPPPASARAKTEPPRDCISPRARSVADPCGPDGKAERPPAAGDDPALRARYDQAYVDAELLWKNNDWSKCGPAFDAVVLMDPAGSHLADAAYAAVLCYNNLYEQGFRAEQEPAQPPPHVRQGKKRVTREEVEEAELRRLARRDFDPVEQKMQETYARYVCSVGQSDDLVRIKYRRARIHYEANHWEEAAVLFRGIAYDHPQDDLAPYAANLYLDCLNALGRLDPRRRGVCGDELGEAVEHFLGDEHLMRDEDFRRLLSQLQCAILWKRAGAREEAGELREAADLYLRIYREQREQCQAIGEGHGLDEVLYNAAILYEADSRIGAAIQIRERLVRDFGDESAYAAGHRGASEWAKRAIFQIGANHQAAGEHAKAADLFEELARRYPGEREAPDALKTAVGLRIEMAQLDKAGAAELLFERNYGAREAFAGDTARLALVVADARREKQGPAAAAKAYDALLRRHAGDAPADVLIRANAGLGEARVAGGIGAREPGIKALRRALALAEAGAEPDEGNEARLDRLRGLVAVGVPAAGQEATASKVVAARLALLVDAIATARRLLNEPAPAGPTLDQIGISMEDAVAIDRGLPTAADRARLTAETPLSLEPLPPGALP